MGYYEEVYLKRLNRYGVDFQSRLQGQREENFHRQLMKSVYYVEFDYEGKTYEEAVRFCRDRFYDLDGKPLNGGRA